MSSTKASPSLSAVSAPRCRNAGLPELEGGRAVYKQTPDEFATHVPTLIEAGANIIGGCCGTGPEHIRRVAALLASRTRAARRRVKQ